MDDLTAQCKSNDRFIRVLNQRVHMLLCIHSAWMASSEEAFPKIDKARTYFNSGMEEKRENPKDCAIQDALGCTEKINYGIELLYPLLDFVHDPDCKPEQRKEFLSQILPSLMDLPPLCLAEDGKCFLPLK